MPRPEVVPAPKTPAERLAAKKALQECRVCAWLASLSEKDSTEWREAINSPRFGAGLVAAEIALEMKSTGYDGVQPGESSVQSHRQRGHR